MQLNLKISDDMKHVFEDDELLTMRSDKSSARRALLWWLWSKGGIWVTKEPLRISKAMDEELQQFPKLRRLSRDRIRFEKPHDVLFKETKYAVIEDPDAVPEAVAWSRDNVKSQLRMLYPFSDNKNSYMSDMGLTIEERLELLVEVRARRNRDYDENSLVTSITSESFYEFLKEFWSVVVAQTFIDNWHIKYLCDEIQVMIERVFRNEPKEYDLIINIAPGSTKSLIVSVMLPAWCWVRMPEFRFIGGSYAYLLAMNLSRDCRHLIKSAKYQLCFPIRMRADQDSKSFFMNEAGGMRMGIGTGGIAGFHGHLISIDDALDPNKGASDIELQAADDWVTKSFSQRKVDQSITPMILTAQRLHENDPAGKMIERMKDSGGVKHICIPAEITDDINPPELEKFYKDGLMDPIRLPKKVLDQKRLLGEYMYAGQYLQSPSPPSGGMFKWDRITVCKLDESMNPNTGKFKKVVRYWDKAGTADAGCYTVGVKMALAEDETIWLLDVIRGQWDSAKREKIIKQTAEADGRECIVGVEQEGGSGGKESAENTAKNLKGFRVRLDKPTGDKILRADAFSSQVNAGIVFAATGGWVVTYLEEMRFFPVGKYKDQIDASSGCFKIINQRVIRVGGGFNTHG